MARRPRSNQQATDPVERTAIEYFDEQERQTEAAKVASRKEEDQPEYRVVGADRVPVSKIFGKMWKQRYDNAMAVYEPVMDSWREAVNYYNDYHSGRSETLEGSKEGLKRGDGSENVVYSNINVIVPAIYSRNPEIQTQVDDASDKDFAKVIKRLISALFRLRTAPGVHLKPFVAKSTMLAELCNFGVIKLNFTRKDDSRERAVEALNRLGEEIQKAQTTEELTKIYGRLEALEQSVETFDPFGFSLRNILPWNLVIDPMAEKPDGTDARWMIERTFLPTEFLRARYTDEKNNPKLIYQPTHRAVFDSAEKNEDDFGVNLHKLEEAPEHEGDTHERQNYIYTYMTECFYIWDMVTRRVILFSGADWTWPLWVWEDPLKLSRFFPYFILPFAMSPAGTVTVGSTSYYLDQQDEINQINKQVAKIRDAVFNVVLYDSDRVTREDAEKLVQAFEKPLQRLLAVGVKTHGEDVDVSKILKAFEPPAFKDGEPLFNKQPLYTAIERISRITEVFRGAQFKSHMTQDAVQASLTGMQLTTGQKQDAIEDMIGDLGQSMAEVAVQEFGQEDVAGIVGAHLAGFWKQMDSRTLNAEYPITVVGGSVEKPNSVFKKREAIEIAQSLGQFARSAPGAISKIILRALSEAFTNVVVTDEDWAAIDREIAIQEQKGVSTDAGGAPDEGGGGGIDPSQVPPELKAQIVQAKQQGASPEELAAMLEQGLAGAQ